MLFFLLPVGVDYQAKRWPMVTFSLMGSCVLIHLWSMILYFTSESSYEWWMNTFWFTPSQFSIFTVFSCMFVHGGIFHLLGNMVYLFLFGASTEDRIGRGRFVALYFLGGVAATFMHVACTSGHFASDIPLGGASGAISACMGAFLLLFPKVTIEFKYFGLIFLRPFAGEFMLKGWIVMSFWFLKDLFWAVMEMVEATEGSGTAFGAHVGGFLFGMAALGSLKLWWRSHPEHEEEEVRVRRPKATVVARKVIHTTLQQPYLIHQWDQEFGPYSLEEVMQYTAEGSIVQDALFWRDGMPQWRPVHELMPSLRA